jgi:polar amino acid transport system substrate-binding protein
MLAVQNGQSDICMAGLTVDEDRLKVMDFSASYATGKQVIIVKDNSDVTLDNLGEKLIGTQKATTSNIYCTDDYGEDHVVAYDSSITAVQALINGQVDCVVVDSAPAEELVKANPGLKILETEYVTENYAIAVDKGNTALLDAVNTALQKLMDNGTVQAIIDKYIKAE